LEGADNAQKLNFERAVVVHSLREFFRDIPGGFVSDKGCIAENVYCNFSSVFHVLFSHRSRCGFFSYIESKDADHCTLASTPDRTCMPCKLDLRQDDGDGSHRSRCCFFSYTESKEADHCNFASTLDRTCMSCTSRQEDHSHTHQPPCSLPHPHICLPPPLHPQDLLILYPWPGEVRAVVVFVFVEGFEEV